MVNRFAILFSVTLLTSIASAQAPATAPAQDYSAESTRLISAPDEIVATLQNGLVVIAKRVPSPALSVRGYVRTGSIYEGEMLGAGLSHLLEHLVAGGSNARRTEAQNRDLLQAIGNNSNAYTTTNFTAYFVTTTKDNLDKAVDLVTGWMLSASITEAEFQREREVVQRELEMDKGDPEWAFYQDLTRNRYRVSPAGIPVIGYQPVIQKLKRDDVYTYYRRAYVPNNMVFAIAGDLPPQAMLRAVQKFTATIPAGRDFSRAIPDEPPVLAPRTMADTFPKLGQARLDLSFPTIRLTDPDLYALDLLSTALSRGESSLLVEILRDQKQLVSSIAASSNTPEYVDGSFSIQAELDVAKIPAATSAALDAIDQIKKDGIGDARLKRAKTQMKTARAFGLQTADAVAESMATDYISTGDPHFTDRYTDRIQKVTDEQIKAIAQKYLDRARLLTTALLPEESLGAAGLAAAENLLRQASPTTLPSTCPAEQPVVKVELESGVTLLLKPISTAPIVVIRMYSLGGLTAEDAQTNGLGNLAMLLAPRGTATSSAQQIAQFFDSIGSGIMTVGGNNTWTWSVQCLRDDFPAAMDIFADVVLHPAFPDAEVSAMKSRVAAAIESQDADWFTQSMRFFRTTYFGPTKSPYQFMPIGTKQNVDRFTTQQIRDWYRQKILAAPRVLAIYGDIDVQKARQIAEKYFGQEKAAAATGDIKLSSGSIAVGNTPASITISRVEVQKTSNPQAGILIGFKSDSVIGDRYTPALTVAKTMAAGYSYPTGYLFETLRGEGLVYDVQAFAFQGRNKDIPGTFIVYAGCDPKNVTAVIDGILENIARLQGKPQDLVPQWFDRAKQLIITADAVEHETPSSRAETDALNELFRLGYDYHARFADRIKAVGLPDVQGAARLLLNQCVVTVTTATPDLVKCKPGVRTYESFKPIDLTPRGVQHDAGPTGK